MRRILPLLALALLVCPAWAATETTAAAPAVAGEVMVNLSGVTLHSVVQYISQLTGKTVILPQAFPGDKQVDIISSQGAGVPREKLLDVLGRALRTAGYTLIETPEVVEIVPLGQVNGVPLQNGGPVSGEALTTRIITLSNANAAEVAGILESLKSKGAQIQAHADTNRLIITEVSSQMDILIALINQLDQPLAGAISKLYVLRYSSLQSLTPTVSTYVTNLSKAADPIRKKQLGMLSVTAHQGANAFVMFGVKSDVEDVEGFIRQLDQPAAADARTIHTYSVLHRDAVEMATVLTGVFAAGKENQGGAPGTVPTVIPDQTNNTLLVVTPLDRYTNEILPILSKLDVEKKQVMIESALVEMSMDRLVDLGVEFASLDGPGENARGFGASTFGLSTITENGRVPVIPAAGGLTAGIFKEGVFNIAALIRLSARTDDVKFIASPLLMALDNQEAVWEIAEEREYPKSIVTAEGFTEVTGGQFNKAAVRLTITPHINEQGTVRLDISQLTEQFLPSTTLEDGTTLVNKTSRAADTMVVVPNGKTAVIAGLTRTVDTKTVRKIPVLGNIPLLGFFFRRTETNQEQRNLCVFITPYVMSDEKSLTAEAKLRKQELLEHFKGEENEATLKVIEKVSGGHPRAQLEPVK